MNKAYRHVYKDGIGWVAIAENGSCVSSSKGSGTVSAKTKVEVLKNFFDLRNSVVLNNGFLLKGLFAATLFCGVFVGDLRAAEPTPEEIAKIQNNGTAVYTDNDGNRMEKVVNSDGSIGFKGKLTKDILDTKDKDGVMTFNGKYYVIPTGTFSKLDFDALKDQSVFYEVKKDSNGKWVGKTWGELKDDGKKVGAWLPRYKDQTSLVYENGKWYIKNKINDKKLFLAIDGNKKLAYVTWDELVGDDNLPIGTTGKEPKLDNGFYRTSGAGDIVINNIGNKMGDEIILDKSERISLVGKDGKSTTPQKYTVNDQQVKDGKRKVGENKDGTIRLGNVAKAELDDEAVNLGQLNERLQNVKAKNVPYVSISSSIKGDGSNYDSDGAKGKNAIAIGPNAQATDNNAISVGYNAGNGSQNLDSFVFIGNNAGYKATNTSEPSGGSTSGVIAIGRHAGSESNGDRNLFIGSHAGERHTGSSNIFIGDVSKPFNYNEFAPEKNNRTDGDNSQHNTYGHRNILIGAQIIKHSNEEYYPKNDKNINDTISIGTLATAGREKSIAIGSSSVNNNSGALATGKSSIAIGSSYDTTYHGSVSSGEASIALGASSKATEYKSIAVGTKSEAKAKESVAIGNESIATRGAIENKDKKDVYLIEDETVAKTASRTKGAVSVGFEGVEKTTHNKRTGETHTRIEGDIRRQITNVAAGSKDSDAVNIAQLKAATGSNPQLLKFLGVTDKKYTDKVDGYVDGGKYYDNNGKELPKEKISIDSDGRITKLILSNTQDTPNKDDELTVKYDRLSPLNSIKTVKIDPNTNKPEVDQKGDFVFEYTVGDSPKNYFETINDITNSVNKGFYTEANFTNNEEKNTIIKHQLGSKIKVGGNFKPLDGKTLTNDNINNYLSGENLATSINKDGSINLLMAKTPKFDDINISKDGKGGEYTNLTQWLKKIENSSSTNNNIKYFSVKSDETENINNDGATGKDAIAIGPIAKAKGDNSVAIGLGARSPGLFSIAAGSFSNAKGSHSIAIGYNPEASGDGSVALGVLSEAKDIDAVAIGNRARAEKGGSIALGSFAKANERGSLALGLGSQANTGNSVALGLYSIADVGAGEEGKYFGVGENTDKDSATWTSTAGAVSVGGKIDIQGQKVHLTRQITNVAAGTQDTDAVNVAQLKGGLDIKANLDASNLTEDSDKKAWKEKLGIKDLNANQLFTAKADGATNGATIGANGELKFFGDENVIASSDTNGIKYTLNKDLTNINSITTEKGGNLVINAGDEIYTFDNGKNKDADTNVVTNKTLTTKVNNVVGASKFAIKGDNSSTGKVTLSEGLSVVGDNSGITTKAEDGKFTLSLDADKVKDAAGTKDLADKLAKKADLNAENLSGKTGNPNNANETYTDVWKDKLGINDKADKTDITNLTTKINNGNFTSLKVSANGGAEDEIKANENIDFSGADGINVNYDATKNKFTFSADSNVIGGAFSNQYAMLNGSNLKATQGFKQDVWRTALGLTNDNIANIFEPGKDISITKNSNNNKYTIAYTGKGTGTGGISETKVKEIIKEYIGGDIKDPDSKNKLITHNVSKQKTTENKDIIAAINKINEQGIGFVHVNGGDLTPDKNGISANDSSAEGNNAIAIGPKSRAIGNNSIAIGVGNVVKGENSGAIGDPSTIDANNAYSLGNNNKIKIGADGSFAIGNNVVIEENAKSSLALGEKTKVSVASGVALGSGSVANRTTNPDGYIPAGATAEQEKAIKETSKKSLGVISVGETSADGKTVIASRQITGVAAGTEDSDAVNVAQLKAVQKVVNQGSKWISANPVNSVQEPKSTGKDSLAIGAGAMATGNNSVALGSGSATVSANGAPRDNTVSVGALGKERAISNVAPGIYDSDAATMGQLRAGLNDVYGKLGEYKKDASAGTASALAVGNLPQATIPGKGMVSLGSGFYDGQSAMAIGLSKMSDSGKWVFKGSASYDSQEKAGAALSVGFHF